MPMSSVDLTYRRMLCAFGSVGGAKLTSVALGVIRTKIVAILLGPANLGLIGLAANSVELVRVMFSFGLESSVARQVAIASNEGNAHEISRIYTACIHASTAIGLLSALFLAVASPWLAAFATGSAGDWWLFATAGLSLLFSPFVAVQQALAQGLRSLSFVTTTQLLSAPLVALVTVVLVSLFGVIGGILAIVANTASPFVVQLILMRRIRPPSVRVTLLEFRKRLAVNFRHGSGLYINAIWLTGGAWLTLFGLGIFYPESDRLVQLGYYQAALALGGIYVGIIISAMSTDYYPAICGASSDTVSMRRLFHQYTVFSLHIGTLVTLLTIAGAPQLLKLFYTAEFASAAPTLRLIAISTALRFAFFPIGFLLLAKDLKRTFLTIELCVGVFTLSALLAGSCFFGAIGAAVAHIMSSVFQLVLLLFSLRFTGQEWSLRIVLQFLFSSCIIAFVSTTCIFVSDVVSFASGVLAFAIYLIYCTGFHYRSAVMPWLK